MRHNYLLALLLSGASLSAFAAQPFLEQLETGTPTAVAPKGDFAFGCEKRLGDFKSISFIYDFDSRKIDWVTQFDEENPDLGGQFYAANSDGIIVGTILDNDWRAPKVDDLMGANTYIENEMLFTAAFWKDGKHTKLSHGEYDDPATFLGKNNALPYPTNGFYATAISEDAKTILGYMVLISDYTPCRWDLDEATGEYVFSKIEMPAKAVVSTFLGASRDASVMLWGNVNSPESYIITDGEPWRFYISDGEFNVTEPRAKALSPDGKLVLFECLRDTKWAYGVYEIASGEHTWIEFPSDHATHRWFAADNISNRGDGFMVDGGYELYYYNTERGLMMRMADYLKAFGTDIEGASQVDLKKAYVCGVSDDGRSIAGAFFTASNVTGGWMLRLPDNDAELMVINNLKAFYGSPEEMTIAWDPVDVSEGCKFIRYVVKIDDKSYEIEEPFIDANGQVRHTELVQPGMHVVTVWAEVEDAAGNIRKSAAQSREAIMSPYTNLYFFDDLDNSPFLGTSYVYGGSDMFPVESLDGSNIAWYLDTRDFDNNTPFWCAGSITHLPWDNCLESRWFDASDEKDFYFSFMVNNFMVNGFNRHTTNQLFLEYSLDSENWTELFNTNAVANGSKWQIYNVDLKELEGKKFRLRFRLHGEGLADCEWGIDYYGIVSAKDIFEAPKDLLLTANDKDKVSLTWKNNMGAYEPSYNYNSPKTYIRSLGNYGLPLQVACDYDDDKLAPFYGKYITGVNTMVYDGEVQLYHTYVEAIIYDEDLNVLSRGELTDDDPWYDMETDFLLPIQHIALKTPVKIEEGRRYRVAIRVSDYEPETTPIWYYSSDDTTYLPGITDLYSDEDDGESWKSMYDYYIGKDEETFKKYGRCVFNIRPSITDTPEVPAEAYEQKQWFYQVYRDGELYSPGIAYFSQASYTDTNPSDGKASYQVQAYRRDGSKSAMSAPLVLDRTGVEAIQPDLFDIAFDRENGNLEILGAFDSATLYDMAGIRRATLSAGSLSTAQLADGAYILVVEKEGKKSSHKLIIRK